MERRPGLLTVLVVVLGLAFLAGAGYVWVEYDLSHYGQGTYSITGMEGTELEPVSTVPDNASIIAYTDLPPNAQHAFDEARQGEEHLLWFKDDRRVVEALLPYSSEYVVYQGDYYQILILSGHRGQRYWQEALLKFIGAGGIGLLLIGFGVRDLLKHPT